MSEKIIAIISRVAKKPASELIHHMEDKRLWDSFTHLELILSLEEEFNIMFEPEEISEMITPKLLIQTVEEKIKNES
ncbi:hypothetical protein ACFSFZ_08540 [Mixta tenebrionis]|uniref:Acyl carrier protein n=1 Tax=Mixta tenebrionis TaxID=2562439 RepID=A0A506V9W2_9GAMM|nr:acyl carrier protein [Mixta tenebrionis]TPW42495.1 acyl carrier protein [Mixta tenebrionis]